jgi:large subunit ribosomal protein L24
MNRSGKFREFHIKKGDTVVVLSGDEAGKTGKVLQVNRKKRGAIIERVNFIKRHVRPGHPTAPQGGIIEREALVRVDKLMLVCPKCNRPTRVRTERSGQRHVRICSKCREQVD